MIHYHYYSVKQDSANHNIIYIMMRVCSYNKKNVYKSSNNNSGGLRRRFLATTTTAIITTMLRGGVRNNTSLLLPLQTFAGTSSSSSCSVFLISSTKTISTAYCAFLTLPRNDICGHHSNNQQSSSSSFCSSYSTMTRAVATTTSTRNNRMMYNWREDLNQNKNGPLILQSLTTLGGGKKRYSSSSIDDDVNVDVEYYENHFGGDDATKKEEETITASTTADDNNNNNNNNENEFASSYHVPVMWKECINALLDCQRGQERKRTRHEQQQQQQQESKTSRHRDPLYFVDGTLGGGGHSQALLEALEPGDVVIGCDVDPDALAAASIRLKQYMYMATATTLPINSNDDSNNNNNNLLQLPLFIPVQCNFGDLHKILPHLIHPVTQQPLFPQQNHDNNDDNDNGFGMVDGILLDLGVSSHQIDKPERGFAFMQDGPLDMRMTGGGGGGQNQNNNNIGLSAADICNEWDELELTRIFKVYGDEPRARKIAQSIISCRPLSTTNDLVEAVAAVTPAWSKQSKRLGRTATCARIFQSLRIVVNQEDVMLQRVLEETCPILLRSGGRLVVLSYHSMEDRATKRIMRDGTTSKTTSFNAASSSQQRDVYGNYNGPPKPFRPVQKAQKASLQEIEFNSRARSATLRVAERL